MQKQQAQTLTWPFPALPPPPGLHGRLLQRLQPPLPLLQRLLEPYLALFAPPRFNKPSLPSAPLTLTPLCPSLRTAQDCMGGCFDSAAGAAGQIQRAMEQEYGVQDFFGVIEEMRIWRVARSAEQIRQGMDADDGRGPGERGGGWRKGGAGSGAAQGRGGAGGQGRA